MHVPCADRALRRVLLESLDQYAGLLPVPVLEDQVFPAMANGFTDANAYIRELTLKAMLPLAPRLSAKTLTQGVLKHLSKLQARPPRAPRRSCKACSSPCSCCRHVGLGRGWMTDWRVRGSADDQPGAAA
jgi:hypothetical protein